MRNMQYEKSVSLLPIWIFNSARKNMVGNQSLFTEIFCIDKYTLQSYIEVVTSILAKENRYRQAKILGKSTIQQKYEVEIYI